MSIPQPVRLEGQQTFYSRGRERVFMEEEQEMPEAPLGLGAVEHCLQAIAEVPEVVAEAETRSF